MKFRTQRFVTLLAMLLVVALATAAPAAITDKYVTSAGAGAADGSSLANALSFASMITAINGGAAAGTRYNVSGAVARTTTLDSITSGGTVTSPVIIRGINAALGDGYQGRTNSNGALVTTNMPAITYTTGRLSITGTFIVLESLNISGAPAAALVTTGNDNSVARCVFNYTGTDVAGTALTCGQRISATDNDFLMTGGSGGLCAVNASSTLERIQGNRIRGGAAPGVLFTGGSGAIIGNVIYRSTIGISSTTAVGLVPYIVNNTIVNNTSHGIQVVTGATGAQFIVGNRITDNGGFGLDAQAAAVAIHAAANRYDRNTSGAKNGANDWLTATDYGDDVTSVLQAAEYTNAAGDDYRLVTGAPGIGTGLLPFMDMGALQKQLTSGSTSTDGGTTGNKFYTGD
jgi:hypothetical protein